MATANSSRKFVSKKSRSASPLVTITFTEDSRGRLSSFFGTGHADAAVHGEDVTCAAVSAILQAAWFGLTNHAHITVKAEKREGHLWVRWGETVRDREDVRAIVTTASLAIAKIAQENPKHVRFERKQEP